MAYYDAISNAISARGNALAQAAQQQGQVYGNLASNLGQLPFQAMQAGQRRRALEVETHQRELQTQTIQDELDFQKEMSAAISGPGTPEEVDRRAELVLRKRPEKWLRYQELVGRNKLREQQQLVAYNATRQNTPGTVAPQGGYALPMPTQGETVPGGGLGNAFEPVTPMAEQMVHPTIQSAYGPLNAQTTAQIEGRKEQTAETTAARGLKNQMELEKFKAGLKPEPTDKLTPQTEIREWPPGSGKFRNMQLNPETNRFDIDLGPPLPEGGTGEPKKYGSMQIVQITDPETGLPAQYWADTVKQTLTKAIPGGRSDIKDIPEGTQVALQYANLALPVMNELKTDLAKLDSGPYKGRWQSFSLAQLGGLGLGEQEIAIRTKMGLLSSDQIFGTGGKALTETEKELIGPYTIQQTDTLGTALAKLPELEKRVTRIKQGRMTMMQPRTRAAHGDLTSPEVPTPTGNRRISDKSDDELKAILGIK